MNNMNWDDLRYFLAVAETGTLSAAAKRLLSNQPTVGRHISALESALGVLLFHRSSAGLALTIAGEELYKQAQQIEGSIFDIVRKSGEHQQPEGNVRIAIPEGLCNYLVIPELEKFYNAFPKIQLILNVSSRSANLTRGEADIAIRLFRPRDGNLVVRRLGTMNMGLCAARSYLDKYGVPDDESDLSHHRIVTYGDELESLGENVWLLESAGVHNVVLKSDSTTSRITATEQGFGISVQPELVIERSERLEPVLEQVALPSHPVWLVYHRDLRNVHRIRVVLDFLATLFSVADPEE